MEVTNRRKKTGWKLNEKGKRNVELIISTVIAGGMVASFMALNWLVYILIDIGVIG